MPRPGRALPNGNSPRRHHHRPLLASTSTASRSAARLEDMRSFAKSVGGCPANIAIGAARLGLNSALITRVGDEHMGRFIREQLEREGVDDARRRAPTRSGSPRWCCSAIRDERPFPLIFYRDDCADMALDEADIDAAFIASARAVLVTGTHLRQAEHRRRAAEGDRAIARRTARKVVLDIDYRPNLWGLAGHGAGEDRFIAVRRGDRSICRRCCRICDLIVGTEEEIHIAGGTDDTLAALRAIRALTPAHHRLQARADGLRRLPRRRSRDASTRASSARASRSRSTTCSAPATPSCPASCAAGCATSHSPTCCDLRQRLRRLRRLPPALLAGLPDLAGAAVLPGPRQPAPRAAQGRGASTTSTGRPRAGRQPRRLMALAIDHRAQFEEMADAAGAPRERIDALQAPGRRGRRARRRRPARLRHAARRHLRPRGAVRAADHGLLDRPAGRDARARARCASSSSGRTSARIWPNGRSTHMVKVLCFYHPDDPTRHEAPSRSAKLKRALRRRARNVGRELLVEIIAAQARPARRRRPSPRAHRPSSTPLGIKPDWWKLEPQPSRRRLGRHRRARSRPTIRCCRGVVLLGLEAPAADLASAFARSPRAAPWSRASPSAAPSSPTPPGLARRRDRRRGGGRRHGARGSRSSARRMGRGARAAATAETVHDAPDEAGTEETTMSTTIRLTMAQALVDAWPRR